MNAEDLSFEDFLKMILSVLEKAGIDYMIGGALAVWPWGEPRATQDIDIVIQLKIGQVEELSKELEIMNIYLPMDIILENLLETRADLPLNAIHGSSGYKAEMFLMREGDELRQSAFQRRIKVDFGPQVGEIYVHSPEDLILYKLLYYAISAQTKHIRDIGTIIQTMGAKLDTEYIKKWAREKQLVPIWREILDSLETD